MSNVTCWAFHINWQLLEAPIGKFTFSSSEPILVISPSLDSTIQRCNYFVLTRWLIYLLLFFCFQLFCTLFSRVNSFSSFYIFAKRATSAVTQLGSAMVRNTSETRLEWYSNSFPPFAWLYLFLSYFSVEIYKLWARKKKDFRCCLLNGRGFEATKP